MLRVVMAGKSRRCFSGTVLVGSDTLVGEAKIVTVGEAQPIHVALDGAGERVQAM